ncbi:enoyl-CoA hydratase/isomerase family protein [Streptomyces sp. NPDC001982]|uniref:enoyl-CoA hydratase/isomerase family protein n=1 Tax=Streptomyces sp. NPDC001982 TaxID=3154405 RepID=UPI00332B3DAF
MVDIGSSTIELERVSWPDIPGDGECAIVWLNRPAQLNAVNWEMLTAITEVLEELNDDPKIRSILISGRGRAFSAGGDLKGYVTLQRDPIAFPKFLDDFSGLVSRIRFLSKPVIALLNGITAAGGLELMLGCDFAWAAESATVGDAHLKYGQMAGAGSLALLPRIIGPYRARDLIFSARMLSSSEALEWGLVTRVVPDDQLLAAGLEYAKDIVTRSSIAVANVKYVINAGLATGTGVDDALRLERERAVSYCLTLPDSMEGITAFVEKREPRFEGVSEK